jgi:hypothetical protein
MYPQRKTAQHTNVETTNADGGKTTTNHFGNMSKLFVNCRVMPTTNKIKKQRSATHVEGHKKSWKLAVFNIPTAKLGRMF